MNKALLGLNREVIHKIEYAKGHFYSKIKGLSSSKIPKYSWLFVETQWWESGKPQRPTLHLDVIFSKGFGKDDAIAYYIVTQAVYGTQEYQDELSDDNNGLLLSGIAYNNNIHGICLGSYYSAKQYVSPRFEKEVIKLITRESNENYTCEISGLKYRFTSDKEHALSYQSDIELFCKQL